MTVEKMDNLVLLAALVVAPLARIAMHGVFNVPMSRCREEACRVFLICLTFVAAAYVGAEEGADPHGRSSRCCCRRTALDPAIVIDTFAAVFFSHAARRLTHDPCRATWTA